MTVCRGSQMARRRRLPNAGQIFSPRMRSVTRPPVRCVVAEGHNCQWTAEARRDRGGVLDGHALLADGRQAATQQARGQASKQVDGEQNRRWMTDDRDSVTRDVGQVGVPPAPAPALVKQSSPGAWRAIGKAVQCLMLRAAWTLRAQQPEELVR